MTPTPAPRPGRGRDDRGAVLVLTAILMPLLLLMTSFALDLGRQYSARRTMQAKADVIALDLARLIDGTTTANSISYATPLAQSAARNNLPVAKITSVQWGTLDTATKKFVACGSCVPTAVKVTAHDTISYFITPGDGSATRSAVGSLDKTEIGSFSIGSSLARLNAGDSAALNPLLGGLLGSTLNLSVLDYKGLAGAGISLADLITANPSIGTVDQLLSTPLTFAQLRDMTVTALTNRGMLAQANLVRNLPIAIPSPKKITLGDMLDLGSEDSTALHADVNVIDLLLAAAQVANGSNFINLNLGIPNLVTAKMQLTEPPKIAIGPAKQDGSHQWMTQAHSANLRLDLLVEPALLNAINLNVAGLASVKLTALSVPIVLNGGGASGYLTAIDCVSTPDVLSVLTVPKPLSALVTHGIIAKLDVKLLFGLVTIPVSVTANMSGPVAGTENGGTTLLVPVGATKSISARSLQLGSLLTVNNVDVSAAGLNLGLLNGIAGALVNALQPILNGVSTALNPVLELLGTKVGDTDVGGLSAQCGGSGVKLVG